MVGDEVRRCKARTKRGTRCRRPAQAGGDFCSLPQHGGSGRSPGAPRGNINARSHGFYSEAYTEADLEDIATIAASPDLQDEIALLRVFIRRAVLDGGADLAALSRACGRLTQMVKAQHHLSGDAADGFQQALTEVIEGLTEELGLQL